MTEKCDTWLAIRLYDGVNPAIKCILCNSEGEPLRFESPSIALNFWKRHKNDFEIEEKFWASRVRATPKVVRNVDYVDDYLFDLIENKERIVITPKEGKIFYSDSFSSAELLTCELLT